MRNIAILAPKSAQNLYTLATIRTLCKSAGVREVTEPEAEALWVSLCDPDDIDILWQARKLAKGRPVIMGGFEAWYGAPYLAWADAIVVGEGQEFIDAWGKNGFDVALSLPCVLTMDRYKQGDAVIPSYQVPYSSVPLLRLPGKERYYFLAGRGCKGKCSFCATSWTQPHTFMTDTDFFLGHIHGVGGITGLQVPVGGGKHVHFASDTTTFDACHDHDFQFATLIENPLA